MDNVDFQSIGGLEDHIQYLKDAILLPWNNKKTFEKYDVKPPRGIIFYGPPGTGKTLTAAALANECKRNERKVSFFHQNGAECLTMWLGESERNLRELFKTAAHKRPAIIFFDELDAIAPTRSKRMDQVHSSLVSTLLTLMDGLKSDRDIFVIGATNRLHDIDPALRRPGRFDKELHFRPPDLEARRTILDIHTRHWDTDISSDFMDRLAETTVGYCGADLQALCTEAFMCAMKRNTSSERTRTAKSLMVHVQDFDAAKLKLVPSCRRSSISQGRPLSEVIGPLLQAKVDFLMQELEKNYPLKFIFPKHKHRLEIKGKIQILLTGAANQGLSSHLAPAILHRLEHLPVHVFDVITLCTHDNISYFSSIETIMAQRLEEVRKQQPCIMYFPDITEWWNMAGDMVRSIFLRAMDCFDSSTEVLLLATAHVPYSEFDHSLKKIFIEGVSIIEEIPKPTKEERYKFFEPLFKRKMLSSFINLQQTNSGVSTEGTGSVSPKPKEAYKEQGSKTHCRRRSLSQASTYGKSVADNRKGTSASQRANKRCLQESRNSNKRRRTETPEQSTSRGSVCETATRSDSSLSERERLIWANPANPAEGCEVIQEEKLCFLLQRLVNATENSTVRYLEILYNRISMTVMKHKCPNDCSYFEKELEDDVTRCERLSQKRSGDN